MASLLSRARRAAMIVAVAAPTALIPLQVASHAATSAPAHPFSDPVWYPLRSSMEMGCANGNPGTKNTGASACNASGSVKHGYPAVDFLSLRSGGSTGSLQTDPVYPMGAGIAHIGNKSFNCVSSKTPTGSEGNGAWVWIDHGGGVVSRYHHLSEIDITDGQYVTLDTKLGRTGHSGDVCKNSTDTVNYLHIEVRTGGVNGTRVPIGVAPYDRGVGSLLACGGGGQQTWPQDIGKAAYNVNNWNQVTWHEDSPFIPSAGSGCLPVTPATASRPTGFTASSGNQQVTLGWTAASPADAVDSITLGGKIFRPSQNGYSQEAWRMGVSGNATSLTLTKAFDGSTLINGRSYKFRLTFHNAAGYSQWSKWLTVIPGAVPKKSSGVRTATIARFYIGFGWYWTSKDANGLPMKRFDLGVRKHGTTTWKTFKGSASSHYFRFDNLKPHTSYDLRVRGVNTAGAGPYLTKTYKTKS